MQWQVNSFNARQEDAADTCSVLPSAATDAAHVNHMHAVLECTISNSCIAIAEEM
jgi:hypothetical protein